MAEHTVSAGVARGLIDFAVSRGAVRDRLLDACGISTADLADQDNRINMERYQSLLLASKELTGDAALALHYAEQVDLNELSVVGLITHASASMMDALMQLNRYGQLVAEVDIGLAQRFEIVREAGQIWMVDNRINANAFPELTEITFARLVTGPRRFTDKLHLGAIHFTHKAPAYADEYRRIFRAPVTFESHRNAMQLDESWLTHPVALTPHYAFGILSAHADTLLARLQATETVRAKVERLLMPVLHQGDAGVDKIANQMAISRQTLYRRLKAEGTMFETVLDDLRRKLALHYLEGQKVSVNETAYLVGFSDPSAFSRAFKRWTRKSPRDFAMQSAAHRSPNAPHPRAWMPNDSGDDHR